MTKLTSRFWAFQITFWLLVGVINFCAQYFAGGLGLTIALLNMAGLSVGGCLSTLAYRNYAARRKPDFHGPRLKLIGHVLLSVLVQSVGWIAFMLLLSLPFVEQFHISLVKILLNLIPIYVIALCWNLAYLGYHLVRTFHRAEVQRWKIESEFQKAQLGALKSQVNPHFMFNAINNIRALILENPALAREMLTRFAGIFRYSLRHADQKVITLGDELDMLVDYLEIHKLHFEERLRYAIKMDGNLENETIPPLVLQLLVENSIKHGISLIDQGGEIFIDIHKEQGVLVLEVKSSGSLSPSSAPRENLGIGIKNLKERLLLTYGDRASFAIFEHSPFVVVKISIKND